MESTECNTMPLPKAEPKDCSDIDDLLYSTTAAIEIKGTLLASFKPLPVEVNWQDAHTRLVLQVYLGSNTLEFSAISRQKFTAT